MIAIKDGRHPCITRTFAGGDYIPNDTYVGIVEVSIYSFIIYISIRMKYFVQECFIIKTTCRGPIKMAQRSARTALDKIKKNDKIPTIKIIAFMRTFSAM